jgi:DNA polymerase I-like protein with 3'-5' exonuclease and polymerase domains
MGWGKYNLINTAELIKKVDDYLINENGNPNFDIMSFDLETNGLNLYRTSIVGFSWSVNKDEGFYLPLLVWVPDKTSLKTRTKDKIKRDVYTDGHLLCPWTGEMYHEFVTPKEVKYPEWVGPLVKRWFGKSKFFMWNAPFDINHTFINFGVDLKENLLLDGGLVAHIKNENESVGLKESSVIYRNQLGINPFAQNNQEKAELKESIVKNGGNGREVWRADLEYQSKYACADTFLTFGLANVIIDELIKEHGTSYFKDKGIADWIFQDEVMPVCKEVVIDMKRKGVYIDVSYFKKLSEENTKKLLSLEDQWINEIEPFLDGFDKGKSLDEAISQQRLVKRIMELEGLAIPKIIDKKTGEEKESIAKGVIKKEYEKNPHWIWGYLLGEDEIKYSDDKLTKIKQQLYEEVEGRRYRFNLGSRDHLSWLFFIKLGENPKLFPGTDSSTEQNHIPSIDADNIKELLLPKYPWVNTLLKYKKIQKMQSTYIDPAIELQLDGWMFMDMKQNGTTSGRFSCSGGYNLQTLPRVDDELEALNECSECEAQRFNKDGSETGHIKIDQYIECMANRMCNKCGHIEHDIPCPSSIKKGFIAPPGYKIINADYSSLEPRCFAYMSKEDKIKAVYKKGLDLYSKVYCDIFDKENQYSAHPDDPNFLKKVNKKARTFIKPLVLGIPYGAGASQVANLAGYTKKYKDDDDIIREVPDQDRGRILLDNYLNTYKNLHVYMLSQEAEAVMNGYVDAIYGRRRHLKYAPVISELLYNKLNYVDSFEMSSDFKYARRLAEAYENNGELFGDKLKSCRILEACYDFMLLAKKSTQSENVHSVNRDSGHTVRLSSDDLRYVCKALNIRYDNTEPGHTESIKDRGCWSYIRNILKADLNNAKNHPIQALAGHITNMGMLQTTRLFKSYNVDGWVCNQVHDEITCYAKTEQAELAKTLLQQGMEDNIFTSPLAKDVVMIAEPTICDSLKESK